MSPARSGAANGERGHDRVQHARQSRGRTRCVAGQAVAWACAPHGTRAHARPHAQRHSTEAQHGRTCGACTLCAACTTRNAHHHRTHCHMHSSGLSTKHVETRRDVEDVAMPRRGSALLERVGSAHAPHHWFGPKSSVRAYNSSLPPIRPLQCAGGTRQRELPGFWLKMVSNRISPGACFMISSPSVFQDADKFMFNLVVHSLWGAPGL